MPALAQNPAPPPRDAFPSASAALDALDARAAVVEAGLEAIHRDSAPFRKEASRMLSDLHRCRQDRAAVRQLLAILPGPGGTPPAARSVLREVRGATQELVYAHAETIPLLGSAQAVTVLVPDLLDVARHLTIIDLWIEQEDRNG